LPRRLAAPGFAFDILAGYAKFSLPFPFVRTPRGTDHRHVSPMRTSSMFSFPSSGTAVFHPAKDTVAAMLWMLACLECFAVMNGYVLVAGGSSSGMIKYLRREIFFSLMLVAPVLLPVWIGRIYSVLLYLIVGAFTAVNAVHMLMFDTPVASYVINVMRETHLGESAEFLSQFITVDAVLRVVLVFVLPLPFLALGLRRRGRSLRAGLVVLALIAVLLGLRLMNKEWRTVMRWNYGADVVFSSFDALREYEVFQKSLAKVAPLPPGITRTGEPGRIVVLVIGESSSRYHYGLYGYSRPTTPLLEKRLGQGLLAFTDVLAARANTIAALQLGLTFPVGEDGERGTVADVLRAGGYHVITLSNQPPLGGYDTAASVLLGRADEVYYLNTGNVNGFYVSALPDGVLLPAFERSVRHPGNVAILVHLMGSHTSYHMRSPKDMPRFTGVPDYAEDYHLPESLVSDINEYDTSIAYTDQVLDSFIAALEGAKRPSALLYVSDHGEAVYEDGKVRGHAENAGSRCMFEVPFLVWLSPEYQAERPDFSREMTEYVDRPWQLNKLVYPVFRLAGIDFEGFDEAGDILSPRFVPELRLIGGKDYDALYPKTGQGQE